VLHIGTAVLQERVLRDSLSLIWFLACREKTEGDNIADTVISTNNGEQENNTRNSKKKAGIKEQQRKVVKEEN
jgi:hypothetical protein